MDGKYMGFIIWVICGCLLIGIGIYDMFSKKQANFWANIRPFQVKDVKGYNRATGLLFIGYGLVFILLGLPLLAGQNNPFDSDLTPWRDAGNDSAHGYLYPGDNEEIQGPVKKDIWIHKENFKHL